MLVLGIVSGHSEQEQHKQVVYEAVETVRSADSAGKGAVQVVRE